MTASEREAARVCQKDVWDGPYRMKCGRLLVNGECGRHGKAR